MPKTEHMTARQFLERNLKGNQRLETWDGELYLEMHRGTFTTKAALKRANRELEFAFRDAELLNVLRTSAGECPLRIKFTVSRANISMLNHFQLMSYD